jgi:hypothetical protein
MLDVVTDVVTIVTAIAGLVISILSLRGRGRSDRDL